MGWFRWTPDFGLPEGVLLQILVSLLNELELRVLPLLLYLVLINSKTSCKEVLITPYKYILSCLSTTKYMLAEKYVVHLFNLIKGLLLSLAFVCVVSTRNTDLCK